MHVPNRLMARERERLGSTDTRCDTHPVVTDSHIRPTPGPQDTMASLLISVSLGEADCGSTRAGDPAVWRKRLSTWERGRGEKRQGSRETDDGRLFKCIVWNAHNAHCDGAQVDPRLTTRPAHSLLSSSLLYLCKGMHGLGTWTDIGIQRRN